MSSWDDIVEMSDQVRTTTPMHSDNQARLVTSRPFGELLLSCPWCEQWEGNHVDNVELTGDDSGPGVAVRLSGPPEDNHLPILATTVMSNAPRRRRHTISLSFSCEICGHEGWIHFQQHKGNTFVYFETANL